MTFQSATSLWWLVPLFAAILVLYLLKMRRRDVRVPASFLWPRLTADVRANAPFQRLRPSVLLFLQLLAVALLVTGLANPLRKAKGLNGRATVIVLDTSASMAATDVAPSRFDEARKRIEGVVATMGTGDQLALVEAGPVTRVAFPLSADRARMRTLLRGLKPSDAPSDMGEALRLAAALVGRRPGGRIVLLSDGAFPPVADFSPGGAELVFEPVGTGARNIGVTALDAAPSPGGAMQVYAGIRNFENAPRKAVLTVSVDGRAAEAREVTVPARQAHGMALDVPASARKVDVRVVSEGDILASDNRAVLHLHGAGTVRALLVSPGNLFLERALALEPTVRLNKAPAVPEHEKASSRGEGRYDLVVFDGVSLEPVKANAVWAFGAAGPEAGVEDAGESLRPSVSSVRSAHPAMRYVDLDGVLIEKARKARLRPEATALAEGADGPLVAASERGPKRALWVGFRALDSDFPLRPSFPIFAGNAVRWLTGGGRAAGEGGGMNVRAGRPFSVAAPGQAKSLTLRRPDGGKEALDAASGLAVVRTADRVGEYVVSGPKSRVAVAVNLLDEAESDVAPRSELKLADRSVAARGETFVMAEAWRPILLAALLVMSFEWWWFVKRS